MDGFIASFMAFIKDFSWIYDVQMTKIFTDSFWENIPHEWQNFFANAAYEDLTVLLEGRHLECPASLQQFAMNCSKFSMIRNLGPAAAHENLHQLSQEEPKMAKDGFRKWMQSFVSPHVNIIAGEATDLSLKDKMSSKGLSVKKRHEVEYLSAVVDNVCQEGRCEYIADIGSGLGYLSQVLSLKYSVIGLEMSQKLSTGAKVKTSVQSSESKNFASVNFLLEETSTSFDALDDILITNFAEIDKHIATRQLQTLQRVEEKTTTSSVTYCPHVAKDEECSSCTLVYQNKCTNLVNEPSENVMNPAANVMSSQEESACSENDNEKCRCFHTSSKLNSSICLIGLHSCADLTPTTMKYFLRNELCSRLVIVGCCYHKMATKADGIYKNFPMSAAFKKGFENSGYSLNTFALRLATQETRGRWKKQSYVDHKNHSKCVAYRGILELYLRQENLQMVKSHRRLVKKEALHENFSSYVSAILDSTTFSKEIDRQEMISQISSLHDDYQRYFCLIEPFTFLQYMLQPVLETVILLDRLLYLREHGTEAYVLPVFDDGVSPRNMAVVASKQVTSRDTSEQNVSL